MFTTTGKVEAIHFHANYSSKGLLMKHYLFLKASTYFIGTNKSMSRALKINESETHRR